MNRKSKIYFSKIILSVFLGVSMSLLPMLTIANGSSITVSQYNTSTNTLIKGANRPSRDFISYPVKVLDSNPNVLVYCALRMKYAPTSETSNISLKPVTYNKYAGMEYILKHGQTTVSNVKKNDYMTGKLNENYYITQGALHLFLSYQTSDSGIEGNGRNRQHIQWIKTLRLQSSSVKIKDKIVKLTDDAIEYDKKSKEARINGIDVNDITVDGKSTKSTKSITLSSKDLKFKETKTTYESEFITVNTPKNKPYSISLGGISSGSCVIKDGNGNEVKSSISSGSKFKIIVYKNKINPGKYTVTATINSADDDVINWSYYTDKNKKYQPMIVPFSDEKSGSTGDNNAYKASAKGSFTYCEAEKLGGKWIETKKLKFNGKSIKEGKKTVGNVVELNKKYDVLFNIKYNYKLEYQPGNISSNCSPSDIKLPSNLKPNESGKIDYDIKFIKQNGEIIQGDTGTTSATDFKVNSGKQSHSETKVAPSIKLNVPNNKDIIKVKITAILKDSNNKKTDENVIELYIKESLEEAPDNPKLVKLETNLDDCIDVLRGAEISLKATVSTESIKTRNYNVKYQVSLNGGNYVDICTKKVYGVSNGVNGATHCKYKVPMKTSNGSDVTKIKFRAILIEGDNQIKDSKQFNVKEVMPKNYETKVDISKRTTSLSNGNVISYLKVQKRDKTKPIYGNCGGCTGTLDNPTCPGSCFLGFTWGDWYSAFVPKEAKKLENIVENYEVKEILLRSKYIKEYQTNSSGSNRVNSNKFNNDGYVDLLKLTSSEYEKLIKLKAGYGFEIIVNTKYDNNMPKVIQSVNKQNKIESLNSKVSEIKIYEGTNTVNLIYKDVDAQLSNQLNSKTPIMFVSPAVDEIAYETPDSLFIKMPNGDYEKLDITDGKGKGLTDAQRNNIKQGETIDSNNVIRTKSFEFSMKNGYRKYYISPGVKNKMYDSKVFTPGNGMRLKCDDKTMLSSSYDMKLNVYGGYTDDLKTQLNE